MLRLQSQPAETAAVSPNPKAIAQLSANAKAMSKKVILDGNGNKALFGSAPVRRARKSGVAALALQQSSTTATSSKRYKLRDDPKLKETIVNANAAAGNSTDQLASPEVMKFVASRRCQLKRFIGVGSYAKVYLIERDGNQEALKVINRSEADREFLDRFLPRELEIIVKISHPSIIRVHDVYDVGHRYYIFMEYASNGDLLAFIQQHGALMEPLAHRLFSQLHSAVKYLHGMGICHRDLKCENVLLDCSYCVKLCDFGFARRCLDTSGKSVLSNTFCGSCAYAAPEVLQAKPYDPMAYDVWSLGCVLYVMLCGCMPFDDRHSSAMLRMQLMKAIVFPPEHVISREAVSLLRAVLEPNASKRLSLDQIANSPWFTASGFVGAYAKLLGLIDESYMLKRPQAIKNSIASTSSNSGAVEKQAKKKSAIVDRKKCTCTLRCKCGK